jgi:hypothetical protein
MFLMMGELALQYEDTPLCSALVPLIAALMHRLICHGHDPRSCLSALSHLLVVSPDAGSCVLMLLSRTVGSCPVIYLKDLVTFCKLFSSSLFMCFDYWVGVPGWFVHFLMCFLSELCCVSEHFNDHGIVCCT